MIVTQAQAAAAATANLPAQQRPKARREVAQATVEALEDFVSEHPGSVWAPSLRANLGKYWRERERYTPALKHWAAAWEATRQAPNGPAKQVADYALAHLARLLSNLCRLEVLTPLLEETRQRVLDQGPLSQTMCRTWEAAVKMSRNPTACYRCGVLAVHNVARALGQPYYQPQDVLPTPATPHGCSLGMLAELAGRARLGLVAAQRVSGEELVVPSVAHLRQNHYVTVVGRRGE
jgi:hypothetical protein